MCISAQNEYIPLERISIGNDMNGSDNNNRRDSYNSHDSRIPGKASRNNNNNDNSNGRPLFVQHNYHDHADDPKVGADIHQAKTHRGGIKVPFPMLLHKVLNEVDQEGLSSILSWQPHGRSFLVRKPKKFEQLLMPRYFTQCSKLSSFQRQLNIYGFKRITQGLDRGGYYHEYFLRGRSDLSVFVQRKRVQGTKRRARSSPATEPDFYSMKPVTSPSVVANDSVHETDTVEPVMSSTTGESPQQDERQVSQDGHAKADERNTTKPISSSFFNPEEAPSSLSLIEAFNATTTITTTVNDAMLQAINELDLWMPPQQTSVGCFADEDGDAASTSSSSSASTVEIPEWEVSFHEVDTLPALDEMIFDDDDDDDDEHDEEEEDNNDSIMVKAAV